MQFDATQVNTDPDTVPKAWYPVMITFVDERENSKGTGRLIELDVTILGGEYANRKAKTWISYVHSNAQAQEIGQKALAKICQALNIPQLTDENLLLNKKLEAMVGPDGSYNDVFDWRASEQMDFTDMETEFSGTSQPDPAPASENPNPWQK